MTKLQPHPLAANPAVWTICPMRFLLAFGQKGLLSPALPMLRQTFGVSYGELGLLTAMPGLSSVVMDVIAAYCLSRRPAHPPEARKSGGSYCRQAEPRCQSHLATDASRYRTAATPAADASSAYCLSRHGGVWVTARPSLNLANAAAPRVMQDENGPYTARGNCLRCKIYNWNAAFFGMPEAA